MESVLEKSGANVDGEPGALPEAIERPILTRDRPWRRTPPGVAARWKQANRVPVATL